MLKLKINNTHIISLPGDFRVRMRMRNPMFHKDGSYSFPFNIPSTPESDRAFEFYGRISNHLSTREFPFDLYYNNTNIMSGICTVKRKKGNMYNCHLKTDTGRFNSLIKHKKLSDIDLGGPVGNFSNTQEFKAFFHDVWINDDYNFVVAPVLNENLFTQWSPNIATVTASSVTNSSYNGIEDDGTHNPIPARPYDYPNYNIVCHPYLVFVLKRIFKQFGYKLEDHFFEKNPELKKLVIISLNVATTTSTYNLNETLPDYSIADFFSDLKNMFNISFHFDDRRNTAYIYNNQDIITINHTHIDFSKKTRITEVSTDLSDYGIQLQLKEDGMNTHIEAEDFDYPQYRDPVNSYADLPVLQGDPIDTVRLVIEEEKYYIFKETNVSTFNWVPFSSVLKTFKGNAPFKEKTSNTLMMETEELEMNSSSSFVDTDPDDSSTTDTFMFSYDFKTQYSIYNIYPKDHRSANPRLAFFRGFHPVKDFHQYPITRVGTTNGPYYNVSDFSPELQPFIDAHKNFPVLTNTVYDHNNTKIQDANISLCVDGDYSLYENFYNRYVEFYKKRKKVVIEKIFSPSELANFNFFEKFRIRNNTYIASDIEIKLSNQNYSIAEISAYKL